MPSSPLPPFRFFGGKGGVGKTTCAAAAALGAAEADGHRVLVVSTDPAHSLGDALASRLGPEPTRIPTRRGTLLAAELKAERALERWMADYRAGLRTLAEHGTYLDERDVDLLLDLSLPGLDELAGLLELSRLARESACDEVFVDTAPTGHTLRLLTIPDTLRHLASALNEMAGRHRLVAESFGGHPLPDAGDALIADLEDAGRDLVDHLRDPERAAFTWVLLPETLALAETRDALAALHTAGIHLQELLVNRLTPPSAACLLCQERRHAELEVIQEIRATFPDTPLRYLPAEPREPRGRPALRRLAAHLIDPTRGHHLLLSPPGGGAGLPGAVRPAQATGSGGAMEGVAHTKEPSRSGPPPADPPRWLDRLAPPPVHLLLFGGKGGVGKTTCAAAAALTLAAHRPHTRILLVSTDPAHSLADVLNTPLGDDEHPIPDAPPNLRARELDAVQAFTRWRDRHRGEVGGVLGALTGNAADGAALTRLLDSPPPGVDELLALSYLLDAAPHPTPSPIPSHPPGEGEPQQGASFFDLVVVDTAPTGHALRLLEMPETALAWDHALLSLLLKYRQVLGLGDFAAGLLDLAKSLKRFRSLLSDPDRTRFVAVARPGELPLRETKRLLRELARLSIPAPTVLLNAVPDTPCPWCGPLAASRPVLGGCDIMTAPAVFPPPRGAGSLAAWARTWKETG